MSEHRSQSERLTDDEIEALINCWREAGPMEPHPGAVIRAVEEILTDRLPTQREQIAAEFDRLHESGSPDPWYWSDSARIVREWDAR